jgi:carboxyl-terminal processing protease
LYYFKADDRFKPEKACAILRIKSIIQHRNWAKEVIFKQPLRKTPKKESNMNGDGLFKIIKKTLIRFGLIGIISLIGIIGCGSDNDPEKKNEPEPPSSDSEWVEGVFEPVGTFEALCEHPRSGIDPTSGNPYPDIQGTLLDEMNWQRSGSNEVYLWYDEIIDRNPADFDDKFKYFDTLKTEELLPSGNPKDRFHFTYDTAEWEQLQQSGVSYGYGATWAILASSSPREIVVAFTEPNTSATNPPVNLSRGARILEVDDVDAVNANTQAEIDILNAGLFPEKDGETHRFKVLDLDSDTPRTFPMQSGSFVSTPVQFVQTIATEAGRVGYIFFDSHIAIAQEQLIEAIETLTAKRVTDLVLDLRYNSGGLLALSSQLAYMVAGSTNTQDQIYYFAQFNDKYPTTNPFTGEPNDPLPFIDFTLDYLSSKDADEKPLPALDLDRLFVLTTSHTCSASEALINGLRGVDLEVIQIGTTTCGKPFGFYPIDNCGTTYFTINFTGENAKGFGEYADGFSPADTGGTGNISLPGCSVTDDFNHALGDRQEALLATALFYRENNRCPEQGELPQAILQGVAGQGVQREGYMDIPLPLQNAIIN